jgi:NADH-quinone oxidoreductase subunit N
MAGLSRRSFWLSLGMMLAMLSLAGVPPLAGFFAKFYIFQAAVSAGLVWLAVIGVLNAILGLYYYLIVIKVMFVERAESDATLPPVAGTLRAGLALSTFGILFLGIFATPWYDLATQAATSFLK